MLYKINLSVGKAWKILHKYFYRTIVFRILMSLPKVFSKSQHITGFIFSAFTFFLTPHSLEVRQSKLQNTQHFFFNKWESI